MKGKLQLTVLMIIFLSAFIALCVYGRNKIVCLEKVEDSLQIQLRYTHSTIVNYRDIMGISWDLQNRKLRSDSIKLVSKGREILFADILSDKKVYASLSTDNCWSCVLSLQNYILAHKEDKNVIYLIHYYDPEMLRAFLLYSKIKNNVYLIKGKQPRPVDDSSAPYLFMATKSGRITKVLRPLREDSGLLNTYFFNN